MIELEKNTNNRKQLVFERQIQVDDYIRCYNEPYQLKYQQYWKLVAGKYDKNLSDLNELLDNGWVIVSLTKSFFNYFYSEHSIYTGCIETVILEKYQ